MHENQKLRSIGASAIATVAGGAIDAWVYLAHGHVFATAQSGNIVLMGIALANGDGRQAANHLLPLCAFIVGLLVSRLSGEALKRSGANSRNVRLLAECALLVVLACVADRLPDRVVSACVGFIAAVQMTSLSHIGTWSFNTGIATGNLRAAVTALSRGLAGAAEEWPHAMTLGVLCVAFAVGALASAWATPVLRAWTLLPVAGLIAATVLVAPRELDPIPEWEKLE